MRLTGSSVAKDTPSSEPKAAFVTGDRRVGCHRVIITEDDPGVLFKLQVIQEDCARLASILQDLLGQIHRGGEDSPFNVPCPDVGGATSATSASRSAYGDSIAIFDRMLRPLNL